MLNKLRASLNSVLPIKGDEWAEFEQLVAHREVAKSGKVVNEGEVSSIVSYVVNGSFRFFSITEGGDEAVNGFALDGDFIASMNSLVDAEPSYFSIEALERSDVLQFDWKQVQHSKYFQEFRELVSHDLFKWLERRQQDFITSTPEQRYLSFLARSERINERVADRHIASYLGVTPVHLSRIRKKLKENSHS